MSSAPGDCVRPGASDVALVRAPPIAVAHDGHGGRQRQCTGRELHVGYLTRSPTNVIGPIGPAIVPVSDA